MKLTYKNSLSGIGQLVLTGLLTFVSIPVFIRVLGEEAYGAFSIVTLAGNLNLLANLGLNTSLLRLLSEQGKTRESDHDIVVTLGLLLSILLPLSALAISQEEHILTQWLGLSGGLYERVATLYKLVIAANLVLMLGQTFTTVLDAQEQIYRTNGYQFVYSVLYWGGLITVVSLGYDLTMIGGVILLAALIWFGLVLVAARRSWGSLDLTGLRGNVHRLVRKQLAFSLNLYAAGLLNMLFEPMTKILVSRLIGVREVGYLEIAYRVRAQLWTLATKAIYPIYPRIARQIDTRQISRLVSGYQTSMLVLLVPFLGLFALVMPDLMPLWIPGVNQLVVVATIAICTAHTVGSLALPFYYYLLSQHHVRKTVWLQLTNVIVNGLVILATYNTLGFYGIILANVLAILGSLTLSLLYQHRYLGWLRIPADGRQWPVWLGIGFVAGLLLVALLQVHVPQIRIGLAIGGALLIYLLLLVRLRHRFKAWLS
ncbi:lipopolysaccharide biosynthesis protein [Spirosoma rhododendri]|uniref:Oligosaccharide flippase family protein n=1 Tax=Spirosoma rhododendri TaxID=2728024 RepID=A0A7L5DG85_9BACT|nr:oligosaccharide flippase family protein [Spirosoma rhododendri]QJD77224.1 oligosaccharide flippase family protein [Spirosoma rhododendri]